MMEMLWRYDIMNKEKRMTRIYGNKQRQNVANTFSIKIQHMQDRRLGQPQSPSLSDSGTFHRTHTHTHTHTRCTHNTHAFIHTMRMIHHDTHGAH